MTLTPAAAHSLAALSLRVSMPPRAAPEWAKFGQPCQMSAIMLTIAPPFCFIHCAINLAHEDETTGEIGADDRLEALGRDCLQRRAVLTASVVDETVDAAAFGEHGIDRRDRRPLRRGCRRCVRSPCRHRPEISPLTLSSLSASRPTSATCAPKVANSCAVQRPMPLPPPVTMTTWFANRPERNTEFIDHAFDLACFGLAARPARARATIIFMMPAVPSPISRPITSRRRC